MSTEASRYRLPAAPGALAGLARGDCPRRLSLMLFFACLLPGSGTLPGFAAEPAPPSKAAPTKAAPSQAAPPKASPAPSGASAADVPVVPGAPAAPGAPAEPSAPEAPKKVVKSVKGSSGGSYSLAADESHRGNLYLFGNKLLIAGDQDGDVYFAGQSLQITGNVRGDITGGCGNATFGGNVEESILFGATNAVFNGNVGKDVTIGGTSIEFLDKSNIAGDLDAGGADMTFHGHVSGDATFKGGNVMILGVIGGDCTVETNRLEFGPEARIEGDLFYKVQEPVEGDLAKIVAGTLHKDDSSGPKDDGGDSSDSEDGGDGDKHMNLPGTGGWVWSIFCIFGSLVVGSVCLALFPVTSRGALEAIRTDPLRTAGLGFVAAIVIPFALVLSCILIVTIPFALILLCIWALVFFLIASLPVAVWAGKWILLKLKRPDASLYLALLVGTIVLTLLYHIPGICILLWMVVHFLGFGGIASVIWTAWQTRRAGRSGGGAGGVPPLPGGPPAGTGPPAGGQPSAGYAPQTFGTGGA